MHGHILLERALPLSWRAAESAAALIASQSNHIVFAMLDSLEDAPQHKTDADKTSELLRIEAKLNVIMALLGEVLQTRQQRPAAVMLRFTNDTLAWQVEQSLPVGSLIQVSLYPDNTLPLGITFMARVLAVTDNWMEVDMHGLGEEEQAVWSRWVFRQHRRQVAQARTHPTDA